MRSDALRRVALEVGHGKENCESVKTSDVIRRLQFRCMVPNYFRCRVVWGHSLIVCSMFGLRKSQWCSSLPSSLRLRLWSFRDSLAFGVPMWAGRHQPVIVVGSLWISRLCLTSSICLLEGRISYWLGKTFFAKVGDSPVRYIYGRHDK